ncbi:hypothetical protein C8F04DRAFT_1080724 [Mycena alexandri]|uniref:Uncharacterized protein n=1 Tax=Mycena alexandri TaxID=1745969 RepID=A0AAD6TBA5_9AGAR|nr:hypothetical protein C8F04DRAFT_1080724 [Mycena alexandri]
MMRTPKALMHETLLSFLRKTYSAQIPDRTLNNPLSLQSMLDTYLLSMPPNTIMGDLLTSPGHRKVFLELCSRLENDAEFQIALETDEERFASFVVSALECKPGEYSVLSFDGDSAQSFIHADGPGDGDLAKPICRRRRGWSSSRPRKRPLVFCCRYEL